MSRAHLTRSQVLGVGVVLFGLSFGACGRFAAPEPETFSLRDSAGIQIAENGVLNRAWDLLASPEPSIQIGVLDGQEEYQLFQVGDVARARDGSLVVANVGTREVRTYAPDGTHRVTVGGEGDGPSEFRYPATVRALEGREILVQDMFDLVRFAADGSFIDRRSLGREAFTGAFEGGGMAEFGYWMPDGTMFISLYEREPTPWTAGPPYRPVMTLVRLSEDLSDVDTLGLYGGIQQQMLEVDDRVTPFVGPFGENTSWGYGAQDGTLVVGDNARPEYHLFDGEGEKRVVRWRQQPAAVTRAEISEWLDVQRSAGWTQNRLPTFERAWAKMEMPDTKAYHGNVMIGGDGHVWVAASPDFSADPAEFLVFSPEGRYEGFVSVPGRFQAHDAGANWMVGVYSDENDVEYLRLYDLRHPVD
jgi:hypothetical protein